MVQKKVDKNILDSESADDEIIIDLTLRPKMLSEYIGQSAIKDNLLISLKAAQKRQEPIEHLILYGPPGLGKTTLAHVIANEMKTGIRITSGPAIERAGDLASILTNLEEGDILFIDEIHRLNRNIEEVLYPAMEDFAIDLVLGKGPSAKTMRLDVPRFTLIGATTKMGALSSPLRDRFGSSYRLDFYAEDELSHIIERASAILGVPIDKAGLKEISSRARKTPRVANRLLRRVRDYADVKHKGKIDGKIACDALNSLEIDQIGLDKSDKSYLNCISEQFGGGPVGLETIAAAIAEDKDTIEDVIEPYLLRLGFINRTSRGRTITPKAYQHLGKSGQGKLI